VALTDLREIVCRTPAERQTLLALLGPDASRWSSLVRVDQPGERFFYRDWAYVREASFNHDGVSLALRFGSGSYDVMAHTRYPDGTEQRWTWVSQSFGPKSLRIRVPGEVQKAHVRLEVCDCLAFQGYLSRQFLF
jgi:hypothetical protein